MASGVASTFLGAYNTLKDANLLSPTNQPQIINWFDGQHVASIKKGTGDSELHGFELTVPASDLSQGAYASQPRPSRILRFIHVLNGTLIEDPIILKDVIIHRNCILVGVTSLELQGKVQLPDYLISSDCTKLIQNLRNEDLQSSIQNLSRLNVRTYKNMSKHKNSDKMTQKSLKLYDDILFQSPLLINKGELIMSNLSI